jgi:hypothetical protein
VDDSPCRQLKSIIGSSLKESGLHLMGSLKSPQDIDFLGTCGGFSTMTFDWNLLPTRPIHLRTRLIRYDVAGRLGGKTRDASTVLIGE